MVRAARIASTALVTAGLVILIDAGLTIVWKEPVSSYLAQASQSEAAEELSKLSEDFAAEVEAEGIRPGRVKQQVRALAKQFAPRLEEGRPFGQIRIPAIDSDYTVVEGTTPDTLTKGPGHYPDTRIPGLGGTTAIAGHRTTYGRPFHNIDRLKPGDTIILETPVGTCTYSVNKDPFIVEPTDFSVVNATPNGTLTLTTCHPKNSAAQRLIVQADLQGPAAGA